MRPHGELQLGVGGAGLGVPGGVAAVWPVGVGGGGDGPPGGADLFVVQVGAGGQAEGLERVEVTGRLRVRSRSSKRADGWPGGGAVPGGGRAAGPAARRGRVRAAG